MKPIREVILDIISDRIKVSYVDVEKEFIHFDKMNDGKWRLTITKSLLTDLR